MARHEPIAYAYDADEHCPSCTVDAHGFRTHAPDTRPCIACGALDSEGNPIHPLWSWDEWCSGAPASGTETHTLSCGTCGGTIRSHEHIA